MSNPSLNNQKSDCLTPFQRQLLEKSLEEDLAAHYRTRILIMLLTNEGKSQAQICQILGCCPAMARTWIFMAKAGLAHHWHDQPIGRPKNINREYLECLKDLVSNNPRDYGYCFGRWTANCLSKHLAKEFGIEVSERHINRLLKEMGLSTRSKPSNPEKNTNGVVNTTKISIGDLNSETITDRSKFLLIKFDQLGTDSDINGGKYVRSVNFYSTNQSYLGIFSFPSGIPALS